MELIPAIDLAAGRVVRLAQGDFARSTDYGADPGAVAKRWVAAGARRLHVVDLDGARAGQPVQLSVVASILAAVRGSADVQVAGGLRDQVSVGAALAAGATRAVAGTALLKDTDLARDLVKQFGNDHVVAALDVRDGLAVGEGWRTGAPGVAVGDALESLREAGVRIFAVTAIARDGLLDGPDLDLLRRVRAAAPDIELIASGGVGSIDDLRHLADLGADAAIVGRALYEGRFDLADAISLIGAA